MVSPSNDSDTALPNGEMKDENDKSKMVLKLYTGLMMTISVPC
jgi:hypothetical protein